MNSTNETTGEPRFQSIGAPPEKHADRVVAEMLRYIALDRGK